MKATFLVTVEASEQTADTIRQRLFYRLDGWDVDSYRIELFEAPAPAPAPGALPFPAERRPTVEAVGVLLDKARAALDRGNSPREACLSLIEAGAELALDLHVTHTKFARFTDNVTVRPAGG